jgi:hypothetical protein
MKVDGLTAGVRPQANVDLLGFEKPIDDDGAEPQQRALFVGFLGGQLRDARDVA